VQNGVILSKHTHKGYKFPDTHIEQLPRQDQESVTMSGSRLKELKKSWEAERKKRSISFAGFISELAIMELERRNMLREAAFISLAAEPSDNLILLRDARKDNRIYEVQMRPDKKLRCVQDKTFNCVHVGFCYALPQVRKVLSS
jgi:hypothetical protein